MYWGLFNCYFDLAFWTDVARQCALVHILILCQYLHHVLGGTMCIYMQVAPSALTLQCRRHNVPKAHQGLSSGGASSLLAAGCLMHTHAQEKKQCKVCCCKSANYTKHMTIYKQWNASKCKRARCLMRTQRSRSNAKCVAKVNIVQKIWKSTLI